MEPFPTLVPTSPPHNQSFLTMLPRFGHPQRWGTPWPCQAVHTSSLEPDGFSWFLSIKAPCLGQPPPVFKFSQVNPLFAELSLTWTIHYCFLYLTVYTYVTRVRNFCMKVIPSPNNRAVCILPFYSIKITTSTAHYKEIIQFNSLSFLGYKCLIYLLKY